MTKKLSIVIPTYNFSRYLPETLDSIVTQERVNETEILIVDGASIDSTPEIVKTYRRYFRNIKYVRLKERGGIDRDMAHAVSHATTQYCWLFSGDDLMLPGALSMALDHILTGCDLYLTRHLEWVDDQGEWTAWPTLDVTDEPVFQLSNMNERYDYFRCAHNTEAFFGFIGGLIVKRSTWHSVEINEEFIGTCWAHVARFFEIMPNGLNVKVLRESYLKRRPDNDSFGSGSVTRRFQLTIDGFLKIAEHFFGSQGFETLQIQRVLRNEYHPLNMWLGKFLCLIDPGKEDIVLMNRLLTALYGDNSWGSLKVRFTYSCLTPRRFRKWQPALSAKFDAIKGSRACKPEN